MDTIPISVVMGPGLVALLLLLLFTYLYEQSRHQYFRAWQLGWAAYTLHYAADSWVVFRAPSALISIFSSLLLTAMALCIFVSTRLMGRKRFSLRWYDVALGVGGIGLAIWNLRAQTVGGVFHPESLSNPHLPLDIGLGVVLLVLLFLFLSLRPSQEFISLHILGGFTGVVGCADGFRRLAQSISRHVRTRRAFSRADPADAVGHCDGDGAV